jgi:hypothetical protein
VIKIGVPFKKKVNKFYKAPLKILLHVIERYDLTKNMLPLQEYG